MIDRFSLSEHDKAQGLWVRLEAHLNTMLAAARIKNDKEDLTEHQTAALRGQIRCLKALIALGASRPLTGE